jgi:hypothetical protein
MSPLKPRLEPLQTRKAKTFPSELLDSPLTAGSHTTEHEDDNTASITPPPSYTEFLKVFTPVFGSPTNDDVSSPKFTFENPGPSPASVPSSTTSQSFSSRNASRNKFQSAALQPSSSAPQTATEPGSLQRLRIPSSAICSPGIASPQSAHSIRSPYSASERSQRFVEFPRFGDGQSSALQHVRTTTTTVSSLKRTPRLARPPERKRRRSNEEHDPES